MPIQVVPRGSIEPHSAEDIERESEGEDAQRLKDLIGFALRAPRRRPRMSVLVLLLVGSAGVGAVSAWPRTYRANVRILAHQNLVLPALDNPNRAVPREADNPTKNVPDVILRQGNLVALVKKLALLDRWESERPLISRWKDRDGVDRGAAQRRGARPRARRCPREAHQDPDRRLDHQRDGGVDQRADRVRHRLHAAERFPRREIRRRGRHHQRRDRDPRGPRDGEEAARLLRASPRLARLPILAVSGEARPGMRDRCLRAGCDDFVTKPIEAERLAALVRHAITRVSS